MPARTQTTFDSFPLEQDILMLVTSYFYAGSPDVLTSADIQYCKQALLNKSKWPGQPDTMAASIGIIWSYTWPMNGSTYNHVELSQTSLAAFFSFLTTASVSPGAQPSFGQQTVSVLLAAMKAKPDVCNGDYVAQMMSYMNPAAATAILNALVSASPDTFTSIASSHARAKPLVLALQGQPPVLPPPGSPSTPDFFRAPPGANAPAAGWLSSSACAVFLANLPTQDAVALLVDVSTGSVLRGVDALILASTLNAKNSVAIKNAMSGPDAASTDLVIWTMFYVPNLTHCALVPNFGAQNGMTATAAQASAFLAQLIADAFSNFQQSLTAAFTPNQ